METYEIKKRLGFWEGLGSISDDFNETPQEVLDSLEVVECVDNLHAKK